MSLSKDYQREGLRIWYPLEPKVQKYTFVRRSGKSTFYKKRKDEVNNNDLFFNYKFYTSSVTPNHRNHEEKSNYISDKTGCRNY